MVDPEVGSELSYLASEYRAMEDGGNSGSGGVKRLWNDEGNHQVRRGDLR